MSVDWDTRLRGVVGSAATKFEKELGLVTVGDLVTYYPRRYLQRDRVSEIKDLVEGERVSLVAQVVQAQVAPYQDKRTRRTAYRTEVQARLGGGDIWMTFFDPHRGRVDWRLAKLAPGRRVLLDGKFGRNSFKRGRWELTHPQVLAPAEDAGEAGLLPVYRAGGKVTSEDVARAVRVALDVVEQIPDPLPERVREREGLLRSEVATRWIHRPADWEQAGAARRRLRYDEAFVTQVVLAQRRRAARAQDAVPRTGRPGGLLDAFTTRLPFELTEGQREVEAAILADLAAAHPMQRLLQGEVGSGKTVVALRAMLRVVDSGAQAALLAPTEVLAQQHQRSIIAMLGDLAAGGMLGGAMEGTRVALLTGSMSTSARRATLLDIASGEAGIVVGTHALLQETVQFADLGLVVVDEQHRFGVEQRAALTAKAAGVPPHVLVMTATPIPRTVAMTVFGDLEVSALTELPAGRSPIQTTVVPVTDHPGWLPRVWQRVREEVAQGRQVYVVCPRIDGGAGEGADLDDADPLTRELTDAEAAALERSGEERPALSSVSTLAPQLATGPLSGLRLAELHGRLPPEQKDEVMRAFAAGEVDVLVSTTVIEVGVDVGNATAMVVMDADRFGISQLHQLRGRVGRGGHPGLCLLVTTAAAGTPARERLDAVADTADGFRLAELDLKQRAEGDVLGTRQSGTRRTLKLLEVARHGDVIAAAREAATEVVAQDPDLDEHPALRGEVERLLRGDSAEFLDKG